jgi:hypothetical protein
MLGLHDGGGKRSAAESVMLRRPKTNTLRHVIQLERRPVASWHHRVWGIKNQERKATTTAECRTLATVQRFNESSTDAHVAMRTSR